MQNSKCKVGPDAAHAVGSNAAALAFCILNLALSVAASGCAKSPPALPASPRSDALQVLRTDLAAATSLPGVQHAAWGIVVHSLDRDERLFELNPRTLLVPAS